MMPIDPFFVSFSVLFLFLFFSFFFSPSFLPFFPIFDQSFSNSQKGKEPNRKETRQSRSITNKPTFFFPTIVVFGPAAATWFRLLARHVNLGTPTTTMLARVAVDQGVFAPTFIGVFLSSMAVLEGGSPREKLERSYKDALLTNWAIWPFVQMVNFKLVPLQHRLLFVNVISIGWNSYLSYINSSQE